MRQVLSVMAQSVYVSVDASLGKTLLILVMYFFRLVLVSRLVHTQVTLLRHPFGEGDNLTNTVR